MRFASINVQKGLKTPNKRPLFDRWLEAWQPDVLLVQEPCAETGVLPSTIADYTLVGGNTKVATYALARSPRPSSK